jgi:hypothetical protein
MPGIQVRQIEQEMDELFCVSIWILTLAKCAFVIKDGYFIDLVSNFIVKKSQFLEAQLSARL